MSNVDVPVPVNHTLRYDEMPEGKDFGWALAQLREGKRVQRSGWNGREMWIVLVDDWGFGGQAATNWDKPASVTSLPQVSSFIGMKTADNKFVPWTVSQTDVLAADWQVVDP